MNSALKLNIRKIVSFKEEQFSEAAQSAEIPLLKVAVAAVVEDPLAGKYAGDLSELIESSSILADTLIPKLLEISQLETSAIESFGKAVVVGANCDIEHGHALLHPKLGMMLRDKLQGVAMVPSTAVRGTLGVQIVVPLHYKRAAFVWSHFDTLVVSVSDAPGPNEIVLVIAASSGGRLNSRIGGLAKQDAKGVDGLR